MIPTDLRPEPEALLAEAGREGRGRLKVFLGAAPGVGKTYAMLEAARRRAADGVDVVAAVVETHGRAETEALLQDLDILPKRAQFYRDRILHEMDLDALLERRPALALIDELAHSNIPGSRHEKRWLDVEEVLATPVHPYTQGLLASLPGQDGERLKAIPGNVPAPNARPPGCLSCRRMWPAGLPFRALPRFAKIRACKFPPCLSFG